MKQKDKYINIGGQAVIEGVMMRSPQRTALSVRDERGTIQFTVEDNKKPGSLAKVPLVRGCVNFAGMLLGGIALLNKSLEMYENSQEAEETGGWVMAVGVLLGCALAVGLFVLLPTLLAGLLPARGLLRNLAEGGIRILIFLVYLMSIALMKDMRRVLQYHGAEHQTIACHEAGEELNVPNVKKQPRLHPRCGTTFLFLTVVVSILVYSLLVWTQVLWLRILLRVALLPVVAGVAYEILRLLSKSEHVCVRALRFPGVMLQKLTTKEPSDDMIEVAIVSFQGARLGKSGIEEWEKSKQGISFAFYEGKT